MIFARFIDSWSAQTNGKKNYLWKHFVLEAVTIWESVWRADFFYGKLIRKLMFIFGVWASIRLARLLSIERNVMYAA